MTLEFDDVKYKSICIERNQFQVSFQLDPDNKFCRWVDL